MGRGLDVIVSIPFVLLFLLIAASSSSLSSSTPAAVAVAAASEDRANKSSWGGLFWATAKDEADLQTVTEINDPYAGGDDDEDEELAGGFSSLDSMLQWAIGHSDPAKLKEKANDVKRLSPNELKERQAEIKELMEKLKNPSDGELMKIAVADLNNPSLSLEDRQHALDELLILVEPIDNANDLDKLGGLIAVVRELHNSDSNIRLTSAWILGKACQNNPLVQKQILTHGALPKLMKMAKSSHVEEAIKTLYAISSLIRNNEDGQEIFYSEAGELMLQEIVSSLNIDARLCKKAVSLLTDLADFQLEHIDNTKFHFFSNRLLLKSVVDLISSSDLDLQEKALLAIRSVIQLRYIEPVILKDVCNLGGALETMRERVEKLMAVEEHKDLALDLEILRRDVEITFHRKLEKEGA